MQLEKEQEAEAAVVDGGITSPPAAAHGNSECGTTEKISICLRTLIKTVIKTLPAAAAAAAAVVAAAAAAVVAASDTVCSRPVP